MGLVQRWDEKVHFYPILASKYTIKIQCSFLGCSNYSFITQIFPEIVSYLVFRYHKFTWTYTVKIILPVLFLKLPVLHPRDRMLDKLH